MKESEILQRLNDRLGITGLNAMQQAVTRSFEAGGDMVLLSPTGTGKTVAYLLPVLKAMKGDNGTVQCAIIAPSRELVQQIDGVARALAGGQLKITCCYGGHNVIDEKNSLAATPAIVISTPGRLLDHINRRHIDVDTVRLLVLDEFDKSLELGFHDEMSRILKRMTRLTRRLLTSATAIKDMPDFLRLNRPNYLDFLADDGSKPLGDRLKVWQVQSPEKDKLDTLLRLLGNIADGRTMIFVNYRESVERVYDYLTDHHVPATFYHGGLEQIDRERAVALFNNGTFKILVTTDLAARGLDIAEVKNIVHYHLPSNAEVFTHRNGRTARVDASGEAYVITGPGEQLPTYIAIDEEKLLPPDTPTSGGLTTAPAMTSLHFNAGKKEKISRGDIVGFLLKNSDLAAEEIGSIDLRDHYAIAAVKAEKAQSALQQISTLKIKNKRLKITLIK